MMRNLLLGLVGLVTIAGCSSSGDPGNVEAAEAAAKAMPKSVDELPANMPPEARKSAEGAILQQQAREKQANAQAEAMKRARAAGKF